MATSRVPPDPPGPTWRHRPFSTGRINRPGISGPGDLSWGECLEDAGIGNISWGDMGCWIFSAARDGAGMDKKQPRLKRTAVKTVYGVVWDRFIFVRPFKN